MNYRTFLCNRFHKRYCKTGILTLLSVFLGGVLQAQTVNLTNLSAFASPGSSWKLAGNVYSDLSQSGVLKLTTGSGILVNMPDKKNPGKDLSTTAQYGDADLEFDYLLAKGANSGVYLQGRYEVQLFDSWGNAKTSAADNGGIYERWNDGKPEGQKGFDGHAPRQNVSKAPGLWQHVRISFRAPRFDAGGNKIENAKILLVELNKITIQENVELSGPTRGASGNNEVTAGPLRFQGDYGAIAIRNLSIKNYDKALPELTNLSYEVYKGVYNAEPDYSKLPPEAKGTSLNLTTSLNNLEGEFALRYRGTLRVKEAGEYTFNMATPGGNGSIKANSKVVAPLNAWTVKGGASLPAGDLPIEIYYAKTADWAKPALTLMVAGPGIREFLISDQNVSSADVVDPILINATDNIVHRAFIDLPGSGRVTHAVSVGSPEQLHYTYDLDNGSIVQLWRGGFLDATPMWHERGDGSSKATGSIQYLGKPALAINKLASQQTNWVTDTAGSGFKPKGYVLDTYGRPAFRYMVYGSLVNDASTVIANGQGLHREITVQGDQKDLFIRIAQAKNIEDLQNGLYLVDDKSYYIRLDDPKSKLVIRDNNGQKEFLLPVQGKVGYSILY